MVTSMSGAHQTDDLDDGYLGSGLELTKERKTFGEENFIRKILSFHDDEISLFEEERRIVNSDFLKNPNVLNLIEGGRCGSFLMSQMGSKAANGNGGRETKKRKTGIFSPESRVKQQKVNQERKIWLLAVEAARQPEVCERRNETFRRINHQQGSSNSMFGLRWITDGIQSMRISKDDPIPPGFRAGRTMKAK